MDGVGGLNAPLPFLSASPARGDATALRQHAARDGYLFLPRLLPRGAVEPLADAALSLCAAHGFLLDGAGPGEARARPGIRLGAWDDPRWVSFLQDLLPRPEFAALGHHAELFGVLSVLLPQGVRGGRGDVCRLVSPDARDHTTLAHQDRAYATGTAQLWTAWIPLVDCPRDLGPLAVLPGSHLGGLWPHAGEGSGRQGVAVPDDAVFASSDLAIGDVLFFSGLTVHGALPNVSPDRLRISVDYRFEAAPA